MEKRVFFIAYLFPPHGGGGVQRTVKFLKYLPESGWAATVLTGAAPHAVADSSLAAEVPPGTLVSRVRGLELPARLPWRVRHWLAVWVLTVDAQIGWLPFATRRGLQLLRQTPHRAIYSTSAPYTDHLVALSLQRASGLPWVADFRDPWLDNFSAPFPTALHRDFCAMLERRIVHAAVRVLVVSEPMRRQFVRRYADLPPDHFVTLPNGYDPGDYRSVQPVPQLHDRFTLVYTGSLYGRQQSGRPLLAALRQAFEMGAIPREQFRLSLVGAAGKETMDLVREWRLDDVVELTGYLPHREMIGHQVASDALLLIIGDGPNSDAVFTGKIFEYLAANRPVLALAPPGAATDLLREANAGVVAPPGDVQAIGDALAALFRAWRAGELHGTTDPQVAARFDRRRQTAALARMLDEASR